MENPWEKIMVSWINGEYFMAALAEWMGCLVIICTKEKKRSHIGSIAISFGMLAVQIFITWMLTYIPEIASQETFSVHLLKACAYIIVMTLHIFLICRISILSAFIRALFAFLGSELAWGIAMYGHYLVLVNFGTLTLSAQWGIVILVYAAIFALLLLVEKKNAEKMVYHTGSVRELVFTFLVTFASYALSNLYLIFREKDWLELWTKTLGTIPRFSFILIGLFILYGLKTWKEYMQVHQELKIICSVLEKQKGQYELARANAEIINQRYHDLKNQIAILKSDISVSKQHQWLEGLENKVEQLEPKRLTGNSVLDTILWDKSQLCLLQDIQLSYVMDGHLFDQIEMDDLCVVFGGALDNAMEAVVKIEDRQRRLIHVKAMEQQGFLAICVENINDSPLEFQNGLPVTTKEDKSSHGYGIKGIRYVAEKYGGKIMFTQEGYWFRLTILMRKSSVN